MGVHVERQLCRREYRLSEFNAKDAYDYNRIMNGKDIFLKCSIELENEKAIIVYDIEGKKEFAVLSKESRLMKLKALLDISHYQRYWNQYTFSIHPENLYYDMYGKVFVMFRDVCNAEHADEEQDYLEEYKALIGCTLSRKYSFDDYFQGGMSLLKKDKFLTRVAEVEDWEGVVNLLQEETERVITYNREKRIEVNRASYKFKRGMTIFSFVVTGVFLFCCGYYLLWIRPYDKSVIQAQNAYLDMNYTQVIENLQNIKLDRMDNYQKYVLATSYIKCENLTDEQKTNILATVEIQGDEKILDYWINIGRLDVEDAQNIAQQLSNDQLLIYAYLKERYVVEADIELSGEEKTAKLKDLEGKLQSLTNQENSSEQSED